MSTTEIIQEIKRLSPEEFAEVQAAMAEQSVTKNLPADPPATPTPSLRRKRFEDAKRRIFTENRELFRRLAQ